MFRGRHGHSIDVKGRVSIPAAYRQGLQEVAEQPPFLTAADGCLKLYPHDPWCQYEKRILAKAQVDPDAQDFVRMVISNAAETPIDKQGRILVPQYLREHAGLEKEVTLAGVGEVVELWDTARYVMHLSHINANYRSISKEFAGKLES